MKKLLIGLLFLISLNIKTQIITDSNIFQLTFSIYVNDKKIDNVEYYFEMNNDSLGIHFKTTQPHKFTCHLYYNDCYDFKFKYKDSKPVYVMIDTHNKGVKAQFYHIKLYE